MLTMGSPLQASWEVRSGGGSYLPATDSILPELYVLLTM